MQIISYFLLCR